MKQYGFFIDTSRCTGCNACVVACKQYRNIPPGPAKPMRVYQWEKGSFPTPDVRVLPIMCFHCAEPRCLDACENNAIFKEESHGAVLVDPDKCKGDRNCFDACPYGTPQFLSDAPDEKMIKCDMCIDRLAEGNAPLCVLSCSLRALDFGPLDELREKYGDEGCYIYDDHAPCKEACPAGINIEKYMDQAACGSFAEALETVREITPLAGALGHVCTHPCEIDCFRGRFDDASAIREVKRFLAEQDSKTHEASLPEIPESNGKKVAVIGAGAAGLSCAYTLRKLGYETDVFEKEAEPGGMMRYGIPSYRFPKDKLADDLDVFVKLGIQIHTCHPVTDLSELDGYDAVCLSTGVDTGARLNVPGSESKNIETAIEFLHKVNTGHADPITVPTVVIGGGSVAMDACRTAVRLGAPSVHLVCPESADPLSPEAMPAQDEEVKEAKEEGVVIHDSHGIAGFTSSEGNVTGVDCVKCLSVFNKEGRYAPVYEDTVSLHLEASYVLLAIGQRSSEGAYPKGVKRAENGRLYVSKYYQSDDPRVFAAGDLLTGSTNIISCIAAGNEAARSIDLFCQDKDLERDIKPANRGVRKHVEKKSPAPDIRPVSERIHDFCELSSCFSKEECIEQSERCLHCGQMQPSSVIRREQPKKNIIPWDPAEALRLWAGRHPDNGEPLPDVISDIDSVLNPGERPSYGRGKLMLKARTSEEKMFYTTDDE